MQTKAGNGTLQCIHVCDGVFAIRVIESEHNFMKHDSQDDFLMESVRNACIYIYVHILEIK